MHWQLLTILTFATFGSFDALSCVACQPDIVCPVLPKDGKCYPARRSCSCCDECASLSGGVCGPLTVRCHPDLVCVNEKGEEKATIKWHEDFKGVCKMSKADKAERACRRAKKMLSFFNNLTGRIGRRFRRIFRRLYNRCLAKQTVN